MARQVFVSLVTTVLMCAAAASAQWQLDIESKTVYPGRINVPVAFFLHAPRNIAQMTVPIVVHELNPEAFWTGSLPYDTTDADGKHHVNGAECPYRAGDMNCDGAVNPVDNVWMTQRVYTGRQAFPPCVPCTDYVRR